MGDAHSNKIIEELRDASIDLEEPAGTAGLSQTRKTELQFFETSLNGNVCRWVDPCHHVVGSKQWLAGIFERPEKSPHDRSHGSRFFCL